MACKDSDVYPGDHCKAVNIAVACLMGTADQGIPMVTNVTKGIVYELNTLRKKRHPMDYIL